MKSKLKKILFLLFLLFSFFYTFNIKADSGWDGSYDYGSSGGFSSSSDYWSSSSSWSNNHDYDGEVDPIFVLVILVIIIVVSILFHSSKFNLITSSWDFELDDIHLPSDSIEKIKKILPGFTEEKFFKQIFVIYKEVQIAWMNFNYDILRKYTTDELYNSYKAQLTILQAKKQKNIMEDFEFIACKIVGMEHNNDSISLKVHMIVECSDYVIDKNKKIVRGNKNKIKYYYEMTFIKGLERENKCPSCGAELDANSNKCPFCRSIIVSNSHDFVLSKKQVLKQKQK